MFWAILRLVGANFTNILGPFGVFRRPKSPSKQDSFPKSAPHFAVLSLLVRTLVTFRSTRVKVFPDDGQDISRRKSRCGSTSFCCSPDVEQSETQNYVSKTEKRDAKCAPQS